jgi:hypothetical protein
MNCGSNESNPNTIEKLRMLEEMVEEIESEKVDDEHLREVELESLQRLIVQLKEEIARGETREPAR